MSKKMKQFIMAVLVIVMSVSIFAVPAAAEGYTASIPVEVQIDPHYIPAETDTFEIKVTPENSSSPMPDGHSDGMYYIEGADKTNIDFTFPGLGVYEYTITQERCVKDNGQVNGDCYLDDSIYDLIVYVINENEDNPSAGGIVVWVTLKLRGGDNNPKPNTALFVNKYAKPVTIDLAAKKTYNNKTPKSGAFKFVLKDGEGHKIETVSNKGKSVNFSPITYKEVGTYVYKISEVDGGRSSIIYDKTVYTAVVEVTRDIENKGDYEATVTYKKGNKVIKPEAMVFVNKSITAGNPFTGDQFRLVLWSSIMVISLVAVIVLLIVWKKRKN